MAAKGIINKLNGYTIQDARVDSINTSVKEISDEIININKVIDIYGAGVEDAYLLEDTSSISIGGTRYVATLDTQSDLYNMAMFDDAESYIDINVQLVDDRENTYDEQCLLEGIFNQAKGDEIEFASNDEIPEWIDNIVVDNSTGEFTVSFDGNYTDVVINKMIIGVKDAEAVPLDMDKAIDTSWLETFIANYLSTNGYTPGGGGGDVPPAPEPGNTMHLHNFWITSTQPNGTDVMTSGNMTNIIIDGNMPDDELNVSPYSSTLGPSSPNIIDSSTFTDGNTYYISCWLTATDATDGYYIASAIASWDSVKSTWEFNSPSMKDISQNVDDDAFEILNMTIENSVGATIDYQYGNK